MIVSRGTHDGGGYTTETPCPCLHGTQEAQRLSGLVCPGSEKLIVQQEGTSVNPHGSQPMVGYYLRKV